jgi:hypothetical protein
LTFSFEGLANVFEQDTGDRQRLPAFCDRRDFAFDATIGRANAIGMSEEDDLPAVRAILGSRNIEAALVELTRPDYELPVVTAIAPDLQLLPGHIETARLRQALAATGGGHQWTRGVPLI